MSKSEISIDDLVALVHEELPEDQAKEFISKLNHRLNELAKEEDADTTEEDAPKEKVEYSFYYVHDKTIMGAEGAAPEFFIKVKSDTLPTEIENRLQHALNNVKDRLSKKKKSRKSKKKNVVDNLYSLANEVKKGDFKEGEAVTFIAKDPVMPLPLTLTF